MLIVALVILLCVVVAVWSWLRQHPNAPPDLPGALPIIGHSLQVMGDQKHLWNFFRESLITTTEMGGVSVVRFPNQTVYVITDPEDSLTVANSCLSKPYIYEFGKEYAKNGLILAEGACSRVQAYPVCHQYRVPVADTHGQNNTSKDVEGEICQGRDTDSKSVWKSHRKLLNPSFNQQVLNTFVDEMNVQARSLVSRLALEVGKEPFDTRKLFINYTLSTVTRTSLGLNTEHQTTIDTDYAEGIEDLFAIFCYRFQKVWLHFSFIFDLSAMKLKQTKLLKKLKNIIDPIIQRRKAELKANYDPNINDEPTSGKFKPILDQMLKLAEEQDAFTETDIREHLDTFVAAAYDTTSSALTFLLIVIGSYRDVQERIFKELQEVLEHEDDDLTKQDLQKLVYLEAVIKELLRMYPTAPMIGRQIDKDVNLKNCTLRAGGTCAIGVYGLLRHPLWGPDADQFKPERWLNSANLPDHPSLYAAFGVGKRNCIGKLYGMMVMKMALAHILRRYRVTGDIDKVVCEFDITLKPVEGHHISLSQRA